MIIKYKKNQNIKFTIIDDILVNIGIITKTVIINIQLWLDTHVIIIEASNNNIIRLKTEFFPKNNEILLDINLDSLRLIINDIEEFVFEDVDIMSINTDCNHINNNNNVYESKKYKNEIIINHNINCDITDNINCDITDNINCDITDNELDKLIEYILLL